MAMGRGELSPQDFKTTKNNWIQYTKKNHIHVSQGLYTDFEWKDYCPAVFRFPSLSKSQQFSLKKRKKKNELLENWFLF